MTGDGPARSRYILRGPLHIKLGFDTHELFVPTPYHFEGFVESDKVLLSFARHDLDCVFRVTEGVSHADGGKWADSTEPNDEEWCNKGSGTDEEWNGASKHRLSEAKKTNTSNEGSGKIRILIQNLIHFVRVCYRGGLSAHVEPPEIRLVQN